MADPAHDEDARDERAAPDESSIAPVPLTVPKGPAAATVVDAEPPTTGEHASERVRSTTPDPVEGAPDAAPASDGQANDEAPAAASSSAEELPAPASSGAEESPRLASSSVEEPPAPAASRGEESPGPASSGESADVAEDASSSASTDVARDAATSDHSSAAAPGAAASDVPADAERYHARTSSGARLIVSGNAPNIQLRVERGLTIDERGRKNHGPQTIYLDGVYSGPPFLDNEARHYSLDHHAGCVRAFTLSTCEQAVVMLLQGLPLSSGTWTLYVNDPDLDSMLAAWVLLNHVELLGDDKALLRQIMPVIRLEGVIDAHGTDRELLTGFPESFHAEVRARVDALMAEERTLKSDGAWASLDFVRYAKTALERIDRELLSDALLVELCRTQEAGRASLANGRIGVLLESTDGIYEVEARLKERYGSALGVIVLSMGSGRYTLRLVDAFLRKDLNAVYRALNKIDPEARSGGESPNLWGGSGDIGGSPRATGTGLSGPQILAVLESVLGEQPPWYEKVWRWLKGLVKPEPPVLPPGH